MDGLTLNLGRFNQCVSYLMDGQNADYFVNHGSKVFYYMSHDGDIVSTKLAYNGINVPTFAVDGFADNGRIDNKEVLERLLSRIELDILTMVKKILKESGGDLIFDNIHIPICSVQVFDDDKSNGCYGWASVGVAVSV